MDKLVLTLALVLVVPGLKAQQEPPQENQPRATASETAQTHNMQTSVPDAIKPGHPLDPSDVDILTGKRDREIEASRRSDVSVVVGGYGGYGNYGDFYANKGRLGTGLNVPLLPLTRVSNPFLLFSMRPRGFRRGGFRGGR